MAIQDFYPVKQQNCSACHRGYTHVGTFVNVVGCCVNTHAHTVSSVTTVAFNFRLPQTFLGVWNSFVALCTVSLGLVYNIVSTDTTLRNDLHLQSTNIQGCPCVCWENVSSDTPSFLCLCMQVQQQTCTRHTYMYTCTCTISHDVHVYAVHTVTIWVQFIRFFCLRNPTESSPGQHLLMLNSKLHVHAHVQYVQKCTCSTCTMYAWMKPVHMCVAACTHTVHVHVVHL
jgi:hypothetical protein